MNQSIIKIVTVANKDSGYLKWLKESCIRHGTELIILGDGIEWNGNITKIKIIDEFLENEDDSTIICFVDAYDIIMLKDIEKLKEDFLNYTNEHNCRIICALDVLYNTGIGIIDDTLNDIKCNYFSYDRDILINSGTYICYVDSLKMIISSILEMNENTGETDDQKFLNMSYRNNKHNISVDLDNLFFKVIPAGFYIDRYEYNCDAHFIHRAGNGPLINFLESNGYIISSEEKYKLTADLFYELSKKVTYNFTKIIRITK